MEAQDRHIGLNLNGYRCVVTGGSGHIGKAIIEAFESLGARALAVDVDESADIVCDLSNESAQREAIVSATTTLGGLDCLVHAAAYVGTTEVAGWGVPFEQQRASVWESALRVNTTSAFILAQAAHDALRDSGNGSIILIGSIYGMVGPDMRLYDGTNMANPAGYAASKGALLQLTRYLATALAPTIRVNAVSPGGVSRGQPEQFQQRYIQRTPLARMASEQDIVGPVAFLASQLASYITGQNLVVDGGWTAW